MTCPGEIQLALASPLSLTFQPISRALEGVLSEQVSPWHPRIAGLGELSVMILTHPFFL